MMAQLVTGVASPLMVGDWTDLAVLVAKEVHVALPEGPRVMRIGRREIHLPWTDLVVRWSERQWEPTQ